MFDSDYCATRKITAAQKIAEITCERIAAHEEKVLTPQFWLKDEWKKVYATQIRHANRLLKIYDVEAIIRTLREHKRVRSLGPKFLEEYIEEHQKAVDVERELARKSSIDEKTDASEAPRRGPARKSVRQKLEDI